LSPHSGALCNRTCHQRTKARRGGSLAGPSCQSSAVASPQAVFCLSVGRYEEESDDATSCRIRTLSTVREWARLPLMEMVRQFSCPRHARCTNQTLSRLLRCTLDFRVGSNSEVAGRPREVRYCSNSGAIADIQSFALVPEADGKGCSSLHPREIPLIQFNWQPLSCGGFNKLPCQRPPVIRFALPRR
jgi:hypothetical protein